MAAKPKASRASVESKVDTPPLPSTSDHRGHSPQSAADSNQQLVERYTEIARLAGGLAHEIKNPLSTIRLNLELLAEEFSEPESPRDKRALKRIALVERECLRLQGLLDDFLNFAKVRQLRFKPADLNSEVERVIDFFRPQAEENKIEIVCYLDSNLPPVRLDPEAFHGALLNLILNAQQAMPHGGQLVTRTQQQNGFVTLELIDTGIGMSQNTAQHIFEAFYSTKPRGSGLGLPTARKIIEAHGGSIEVDSELDHGTKFTIVLPAAPPKNA